MEDLRFANLALGEENPDPFKRLPDGLIVSHILDKVSEAKYLFRCSLVSKRFSSLVFKSESVSFKIPVQIPVLPPNLDPGFNAHPAKLVHSVIFPMGWIQYQAYALIMGRSSPPHCVLHNDLVLDYLPKFLAKFTQLKSFLVELDFSASGSFHNLNFNLKEPAVKWAFDPKSRCFVMLIAPKGTDALDVNIYAMDPLQTTVLVDIHVGMFVSTCIVMRGLIRVLPESVTRVIITDSEKNGKIDLEGSEIEEIVGKIRPLMNPEEESKMFFKIWEESTLEQLEQAAAMTVDSSIGPDFHLAGLFLDKIKARGKGKCKKKGKKGKAGHKEEEDVDEDYEEVKRVFQGPQAVCIDAVRKVLKEIRGSISLDSFVLN